MSYELTPEMLVPLAENIEIISIQFLEFDTSGELIVINQDDTNESVSLSTGDTVTFRSISNNLNPAVPIGEQLDFLPDGIQVTLRGRSTDGSIVSNRITWSYTNDCDAQPLDSDESIGWITTVSIYTLLTRYTILLPSDISYKYNISLNLPHHRTGGAYTGINRLL